MATTAHSHNIGMNYEGRLALYVEGVRCPFTEVQIVTEDGLIPRIIMTIPSTPSMRDLPRRARIHFVVREMVKDEWIVMFEGEVMSRGFRKTPSSRDLTFMGYHVAGHLDQYAISALDPASKTQSQMQAAPEFTKLSLASVNGTILALFNPTVIAGLVGKDPEKLTYPDFVKGASERYKQIIDASRIAEAYPHEAVEFHRLFDRIKPPHEDLFDWDDFYSRLMVAVFNFGVQTVGGRVTFWEFIRHISQFFLHQISVVPNAEHWTKQIQIRPATYFHPIPRCNIVYSSMTEEYAYEENYETKPTRLEAKFLPIQTAPGQDLGPLARFHTVFAPSELQELWRRINNALEDGDTTIDAQPGEDKDGKPTVTAPADGIKFLTREEEQRGIITGYYDIPQTLNHAILSLVESPPGGQETSAMRNVASGKALEHGQKVLKGTSEADRIEKYRAFLCMALGDGGGIRPGRFGPKGPGEDYRRPGQMLHILTGSSDARFPNVPKIIPRRITVVPLDLKPHYVENRKKQGFKHPDNKSLFIASGINYFVDAEGNVLQVAPRRAHTFSQPSAIPFGIAVTGIGPDQAAEINAGMLSLGQNRKQAKDKPFFVGTVNRTPFTEDVLGQKIQTWPQELTDAGIPNPHTDEFSPVAEFYFDERVGAGDPTLAARTTNVFTQADFEKIEKNRTEFTVSSYRGAFDYIGKRDEKAIIVDVRAIQVAGNKAIYWVKLNRPIVQPLAKHRVFIQNRTHEGKEVTPNKPWVIIPGTLAASAPVGPKTPVTMSTLADINEKSSISNPAQLSGGGHYNLAIGVETRDGRLTPKCQAGLAWLTAVLQELTVETAGTLKQPLGSQAQRRPRLHNAHVNEIAEFYHAASGYRRLQGGVMQQVKQRAQQIASALYKDFNQFDNELVGGKVDSLAGTTLDEVTAAGDHSAIPGDISNETATGAGDEEAAASAAAAGEAFTEAVQVNLDYKMLDNIIDNYVGAITNFEFYNMRYAPQSFTARLVFNPYMLAGYPCMLLDDSEAKYHLVGFVHSLAHVFSADGMAFTSATYTHLRNARHEKLIPYSIAREQYFLFRDVKPWREGEKYREEYHARLKALDPPAYIEAGHPSSFIPWELLDYRSKKQPPFLFSGGFGFDKELKRNFQNYAAFAGYVDGGGAATDLEAKNQFVYADDPLIQFKDDNDQVLAQSLGVNAPSSTEGQGQSGAAATKQDIDARRALELTYRKVQRVDQLDPDKTQASLVAFVHGPTRDYEHAPINIDVYTKTPPLNPDGTPQRELKEDGFVEGAIPWQNDIQVRVYDHLELLDKHTAIPG